MNRAGGEQREESLAAETPRDHYIALRPDDLVNKLVDHPSVTIFERHHFRQLCSLIAATIHHDYRSRLVELKAAYAPFDPDDDAARLSPAMSGDLRDRSRRLFQQFDQLMARANYRKLSREELEQAVRAPNHGGVELQLDLELFERLEIYVRGHCELVRSERGWRGRATKRQQIVPAHRRLVVVFRLKEKSPRTEPLDTRAIVLKLFKDIPHQDVETLLPGASVRIGWLEQAQIAVPTAAGIGLTLFKLTKGAAAVAFASAYGLAAFLGLVSGAVGYGVRSFHSYLRTREKHQLSLTRSLYFQNLDNNGGVIHHLLAEAEDQEFREVVLAWWLLWRGGLIGATARQIDEAAEQWLAEQGVVADFEVADALAQLRKLGIARATASGGWRAVPIEEALETLDRAWDGQFDYRPQKTAAPRIWRAAAA